MSRIRYRSRQSSRSLIESLQGLSEFRREEGGTVRKDRSIQNLALAILIQAFRDLLSSNTKLPKEERVEIQEDALGWFYSKNRAPGSLEWVGEIIDINPDVLREWLRNYRQSDQESQYQMARPIRRMQLTH